MLNFHTFL